MDPLLHQLQRGLQGRYVVEHELGRGGMAVVYLGRDVRLDRRVAIKVFAGDGGAPRASDRFLREIRVAAQLQHPNILPVFESGETDGIVYYVMPYVSGGSLRERLEREGALPVADALRIARETAEALDHAHRAGIVHRDVKPDNILLADGVAVVADFGIARAIEESGVKVTDTGLAVGTPNYMSPEQAAGSSAIDGRADIYALGCVMYELLAGAPPFAGATARDIMARHATDAPPPLSTIRAIPPALEQVVFTAMAKAPADRFASGRAMSEAIVAASAEVIGRPVTRVASAPHPRRTRFLIAASVALVVAVAVTWRAWPARRVAQAAEPTRSVAVLPVVPRGDSTLVGIADGFTEDIITALYRVEGLRVPSLQQVLAYRNNQEDPRAVGRALGVEAVLTSSLQRAGGVLRMNVQLISVRDGRVLWPGRLEGDLTNIFPMHDSVSAQLVSALQINLRPAQRAALAGGVKTRDTIAYKLYLDARTAYQQLNHDGAQRAVTLAKQALARDSTFADAWSELAGDYELLNEYTVGGDSAAVELRNRATARAIEFDSTNVRALIQAGYARMDAWDMAGARTLLHRAMRQTSGPSERLLNFAQFLARIGEIDSALAYARRATAGPSPTPLDLSDLAAFLGLAGHRDTAILLNEQALARDSTTYNASHNLMWLYLEAGRPRDAERAVQHWLRFTGQYEWGLREVASYYALAKDQADGRAILGRILAIARQRPVSNLTYAVAYSAAGDRARALDFLERDVRVRSGDLTTGLPGFHGLEGDARFEAIKKQVYGNVPVGRFPF